MISAVLEPTPEATEAVLAQAAEAARTYLAGLPVDPVQPEGSEGALTALSGPLPEEGEGAVAALARLAEAALGAATRSAGPRFFHFVIGGTTPAALAADWLTSALDQNAGLWVASPLGSRLEELSLAWLRDLFGLPSHWGGVLTTGATMANFTGLAAARRWWSARHGADVDEEGLAGLPPPPVLTSGYVHASVGKALAMLGIGRAGLRVFAADATGRLDEPALRGALDDLRGAPAILVATAGEVNTGAFDPIEALATFAEEHGCWLHVDGAFGLFARLSPAAAHLAAGVERAQSVAADGHKWLNVPYDCGFCFLADPDLLQGAFGQRAAYYALTEGAPDYALLGPESSRRARGLAVWATLAAYGRAGYRNLVERHLALAQRLAARVDEAPDLEPLAETPFNIVCFRYRPLGTPEAGLDELNRRLGREVLADRRVFVGTTTYAGRVAFRPAIVNWRTTEADIDLLVEVIRELGAKVAGGGTR